MITELQILFFIIEKDQIRENKYAACYINVGDIKNRKIDQAKINEIAHIRENETVNEIADSTCRNKAEAEADR